MLVKWQFMQSGFLWIRRYLNMQYLFIYCTYLGCTCDTQGTIDGSCYSNGQCQCKEGCAQPRCDKCLEGFYGFPDCKPCNCFYPGQSHSNICNITNGQCDCKKDDYSGRQCSPCSSGYYLSSYDDSYEYRASVVCYLDQNICNASTSTLFR